MSFFNEFSINKIPKAVNQNLLGRKFLNAIYARFKIKSDENISKKIATLSER